MSELFWNKILGAALGTGLVLFGLNEMGHIAVHTEAPDELAYAIALETETEAAAVDEGPLDLGMLLQNASVTAGEATFKAKCTACHNAAEGGPNGVGPALWGVYGRTAGAHAGYSYSSAMQAYAQPWVADNLYAYLERPQKYIDGTAMNFIGLRKQEERVNVIAYLNSLANTPEPLPAPLDGASDADSDNGGDGGSDEAAAAEDAVQAG